MNPANRDTLEAAANAILANEGTPSPERIAGLIEQLRIAFPITDKEAQQLARVIEDRQGVTMSLGSVLVERGHEPWLESARAEINPYYWERYRILLAQKDLSSDVINAVYKVTEHVLGLMENPKKPGPWDRRGMVVGHVQSGKTANYIGLINKAADAGYRVIIVIAGIHNNLRNQTQDRIDEGFVGFDSSRLLSKQTELLVGVGKIDQRRRPVTFTNSLKDFSKAMATGVGVPIRNLNEPAVFVIKKNSTTLKNLIEWLKGYSAARGSGKVDEPMLLIDDEADNASVNIRYGKEGVSRINAQIRELLTLFEKRCYIGYTATPFANIFIDPASDDEMLGNDLFPKHFIASLDPPTNYFGPRRVFLDEPNAFVRHIDDNEDVLPMKHKIDHELTGLPQSLLDAVRAFVLARGIRILRGQRTQHSSMLVNASRFTGVQKQLANEIQERLTGIQASLRVNGALPPEKALQDPEIGALQRVWSREFRGAGPDWAAVQSTLHEAAAPMKVVEVNSRSSGALNYSDHEKHGLGVIAVGGYSLSRGLTLEGLMTSYFLRNSMMYDTLMQMGRWFGYRKGYDDVCRIWMPEEAEGWYAHIAESIEMLRDELRSMEAANATPAEFGLKVRSHPDTLIVTARNKFGSGEKVVVNVGLANSFIETAVLKRAEASLENNREAVRQFSSALRKNGKQPANANLTGRGFLLQDVPCTFVDQFLGDFDNHPASMLTDPGPVRCYIAERADGELQSWDVLFASLQKKDEASGDDHGLVGTAINLQRRSAGSRSDASTLVATNKQRVASRGVEQAGLSQDSIDAAQAAHRKDKNIPEGTAGISYPDHIYRLKRQRPLLIVHLLKIDPEKGGKAPETPVVAWSISFPRTRLEEKRVEYIVNTTWMRENMGEDLEEEEMAGDDE